MHRVTACFQRRHKALVFCPTSTLAQTLRYIFNFGKQTETSGLSFVTSSNEFVHSNSDKLARSRAFIRRSCAVALVLIVVRCEPSFPCSEIPNNLLVERERRGTHHTAAFLVPKVNIVQG